MPFIEVVGNTSTKLCAITLQNTYCRFITHVYCVAFVNVFQHFICSFFRDVVRRMLVFGMWWYVTRHPVVRPHHQPFVIKGFRPHANKSTGRLGCQRRVVVPNLRFATSHEREDLNKTAPEGHF
jgi:hypothetical protein